MNARQRPGWAGELLVVFGLLVVYDRVAGLAKLRVAEAVAHGRALLAVEHSHLERDLDSWLDRASWLHAPAAYYYDVAHICVTVGVLLAAYLWRAEVYRRARTALVAINLVGLAGFLLYPVAPPRLLPGAGFVDIVSRSGTWGAWETGGAVAQRANEFGSMPSLHAAWAVWVALTVTSMTRRGWLRALGWAHVVLTTVVVLATGNHYWVDVLAGAAICALGWWLAGLRRRSGAPPVPVEAHSELPATVQV